MTIFVWKWPSLPQQIFIPPMSDGSKSKVKNLEDFPNYQYSIPYQTFLNPAMKCSPKPKRNLSKK